MLVYVTGNYGKYIGVRDQAIRDGIKVDFMNFDFDEPDVNDIEVISKAKVLNAYKLCNCPCFVADTGFYIKNFPNNPEYPGAFVKRSGISSDIDNLLDVMKDVKDRSCKFVDCLTYYDGNEFYTFYGISEGNLSFVKKGNELKKAKSNLWYVFIPNNCNKTLAEMTDEERLNRNDGHTSATEEFFKWYKENVLKGKLTLKKN